MKTWSAFIIAGALMIVGGSSANATAASVQNKPKPAPSPTVAIAFLGSDGSYATFVAPLLKKLHFTATFYVNEPPPAATPGPLDLHSATEPEFMTWAQIKQLSGDGFEIGNFTMCPDLIAFLTKRELIQRIESMERRCAANGVPKPVTFCYPGGCSSPFALQILADRGYQFSLECGVPLGCYEPEHDHPLLAPCRILFRGCPAAETDSFYEFLKTSLNPGQLPVLVFDGVDLRGTSKSRFEEYMQALAERNYKVCSVRELAPEANPGGAMRAVRCWRRNGGEYLASVAARRDALKQPPPHVSKLAAQLEALILPRLDFKDASLASALDALRQMAAKASNGSLRPGLVTAPGLDTTTPVTLHLTQIPWMEALRYVGDLADVDFAVDDYAISVKQRLPGSALTTKTPAAMAQRKALQALVLPKVEFTEIPLGSALDALCLQVAAASGGRVRPSFVIEPGLDGSAPVTLHLASIPFTEALAYLGDVADAQFVVERYAISARPGKYSAAQALAKLPATRDQMEILQSLVIPSVQFEQATLGSAIEALRQKAVATSGGSVQPSFVVDPRLDLSAPATLHLTTIPFTEVLRYLGDLTHAEFAINRYAISVVPKRTPLRRQRPIRLHSH